MCIRDRVSVDRVRGGDVAQAAIKGGEAIWHELCPGTKYPGVEHETIKGVGHFLQDGGAEQLTGAILKFIDATPLDTISPLKATPVQSDAAKEDGPEEGRQVPKRNRCEEPQKTSPGRIYKEAGVWHTEGVPEEVVWDGTQREMSFLDELRVYAWVKMADLPPVTEICETDWVFKVHGEAVRARLVLKQIVRTEGKRDDTYAPTPVPMSTRVLPAR